MTNERPVLDRIDQLENKYQIILTNERPVLDRIDQLENKYQITLTNDRLVFTAALDTIPFLSLKVC